MTTPIRFKCPKCSRAYTVKAALAGKKIRCKQCQSSIPVPGGGGAGAAAPKTRAKEKPTARRRKGETKAVTAVTRRRREASAGPPLKEEAPAGSAAVKDAMARAMAVADKKDRDKEAGTRKPRGIHEAVVRADYAPSGLRAIHIVVPLIAVIGLLGIVLFRMSVSGDETPGSDPEEEEFVQFVEAEKATFAENAQQELASIFNLSGGLKEVQVTSVEARQTGWVAFRIDIERGGTRVASYEALHQFVRREGQWKTYWYHEIKKEPIEGGFRDTLEILGPTWEGQGPWQCLILTRMDSGEE